jgi:hypothetical protein
MEAATGVESAEARVGAAKLRGRYLSQRRPSDDAANRTVVG